MADADPTVWKFTQFVNPPLPSFLSGYDAGSRTTPANSYRCFGDKGDVEDITEGASSLLPSRGLDIAIALA